MDLPLCLAFFTGFSSMQWKDLFLLGTLLRKLRPCMLGWAWPPFWLTPFGKAPLRDWAMFCWKFCELERISAHSWNPWACARSAAVSPLAFLTLHNTRAGVRWARCTLLSHVHTHARRRTTRDTQPGARPHAHARTRWHTHGREANTRTHGQTHRCTETSCAALLSLSLSLSHTSSSSSWWTMTTDPWGSFLRLFQLSSNLDCFPNGFGRPVCCSRTWLRPPRERVRLSRIQGFLCASRGRKRIKSSVEDLKGTQVLGKISEWQHQETCGAGLLDRQNDPSNSVLKKDQREWSDGNWDNWIGLWKQQDPDVPSSTGAVFQRSSASRWNSSDQATMKGKENNKLGHPKRHVSSHLRLVSKRCHGRDKRGHQVATPAAALVTSYRSSTFNGFMSQIMNEQTVQCHIPKHKRGSEVWKQVRWEMPPWQWNAFNSANSRLRLKTTTTLIWVAKDNYDPVN